MSKLTDLINEISSEMGLSRMTNDEYRRISHKLLEIRIEVRAMEKKLSISPLVLGTTGGSDTVLSVHSGSKITAGDTSISGHSGTNYSKDSGTTYSATPFEGYSSDVIV